MKLHYTNVFNDMNGHKSSTVYNKSLKHTQKANLVTKITSCTIHKISHIQQNIQTYRVVQEQFDPAHVKSW